MCSSSADRTSPCPAARMYTSPRSTAIAGSARPLERFGVAIVAAASHSRTTMRIAFTHNLKTAHHEEQAEFDREETVDAIAQALRGIGHEVARVNASGASARDIARRNE